MTQNIPFSPGELQRGESKYRQRGNLVVTTWRDRKLVYIMSTNTSPTATTTVNCRTKDGHVENVTCSLSIQLYNSYMGGVDRADQLRGYYRVRMKSHKFYRFVLLNLLVFHSLYFILFSLSPQQIHLLVSRGLLHCECLYSPEILSAKHWKHNQATSIQGIQASIGTGADWELQFQAALCTSTSTSTAFPLPDFEDLSILKKRC